MIVVVAALKGGVGKTTTAVYLSALAGTSRKPATLVDADPQASAADWLENSDDEQVGRIEILEAPTDRLLAKALDTTDADDAVVVVDTPPGNERLLAKALEWATVVVVPTRVGGVETPRVDALLDMVPKRVPSGLVMCSARAVTRDYRDTVDGWTEAGVEVWGTVPERVAIAAGPTAWLASDGIESYRTVWRRVLRAARGG